jgi:hypothetical protein
MIFIEAIHDFTLKKFSLVSVQWSFLSSKRFDNRMIISYLIILARFIDGWTIDDDAIFEFIYEIIFF